MGLDSNISEMNLYNGVYSKINNSLGVNMGIVEYLEEELRNLPIQEHEETRIKIKLDLINTIFHEMRHARQYKMAEEQISTSALTFALESVLMKKVILII